jgi:hypothetical protein
MVKQTFNTMLRTGVNAFNVPRFQDTFVCSSIFVPEMAARRRHLRYWPPFLLSDIGSVAAALMPSPRGTLQGAANIWQ